MKIRLLAIASAVLLVVGFSLAATAGSIADGDGDLIPDVFDNCSTIPNSDQADPDKDRFGDVCDNCRLTANGLETGPLAPAFSQLDTNSDGFGNACDCDYTQDGFVLANDIAILFGVFNTQSELHDNTGDGFVLANDVSRCFARFNTVVGDP